MRIESLALVEITDPGAAFPKATSPSFIVTDFPWQTHPENWGDNGGLVAYPLLEGLYPAPLRVPHNQAPLGSKTVGKNIAGKRVQSYPQVSWSFSTSTTGVRYPYNPTYGFAEIAVENFDETKNLKHWAACAQQMQGFSFFWRKSDFQDADTTGGEEVQSNGTAPVHNRYHELRWFTGTGAYEQGYSVKWQGNGEILLQRYDAATATYSPVKTGAQGSDVAREAWGSSTTADEDSIVEIFLSAGRMLVSIGSQTDYELFDESRVGSDGTPIINIERVEVLANEARTLYYSLHPTKFYSSTFYESVGVQIGFRSYYEPSWLITQVAGDAARETPNFAISPTESGSLNGPTVQYRLDVTVQSTGTYQGIPYSDYSPGIKSVTLHWQRGPDIYFQSDTFTPAPIAVSIHKRFDIQSLQTRTQASLTFKNNDAFWGKWDEEHGHVATRISLARTQNNGYVSDFYPAFVGFGHTSGAVSMAAGDSNYTMTCADRMIQLAQPRWALPWTDGWNAFYFIAFFAQLAGVSLSQMAFAQYVPDNPFDDWGDPSAINNKAYFLPVGALNTILTRVQNGDLWQIMSRLSYSIGYQLYWGDDGLLYFEKFYLPSINNGQFFTKRIFYESDWESGGTAGCWALRKTKDMSTVRNKVIVAGTNLVSPIWEPIVVAISDQRSMFDVSADNFLGFPSPLAWADSQFGNDEFAYQAALQLLLFLRMPERRLVITTWFQPDIKPLDLIEVVSPRSGSTGIKFMVTDISHELSYADRRGRSTIEAYGVSTNDPLSINSYNQY